MLHRSEKSMLHFPNFWRISRVLGTTLGFDGFHVKTVNVWISNKLHIRTVIGTFLTGIFPLALKANWPALQTRAVQTPFYCNINCSSISFKLIDKRDKRSTIQVKELPFWKRQKTFVTWHLVVALHFLWLWISGSMIPSIKMRPLKWPRIMSHVPGSRPLEIIDKICII